MASSVASSSLKSGTFAPAITAARGPPSASTRRERFTPFFPLSVGLGPIWSPKTSLAHSAVRGLPLKVHPTELLAVLDETLPDEIQHAKLDPSLEGPVYRGVVGKLFGQSVPLDPLLILKMIASKAARWSTRGRPVLLGGSCSWRIGSMIFHNSSGTRQMVGSGFFWFEFSDIAQASFGRDHRR